MATIKPTSLPAIWVIPSVVLDGVTDLGGLTAVNNQLTDLLTGEGEAAFLEAANGHAGSYKPLPATGTRLEAGSIWSYGGGCVIVRQTHNRTADAPADIPNLFSVYRANQGVLAWIANEPITIGMQRTYNGKTYKCLQSHTTQIDWTPPSVVTLWAEVSAPGAAWGYPVAYKVNDLVTYLGNNYKCLQAHTSNSAWTPVATINVLWVKI